MTKPGAKPEDQITEVDADKKPGVSEGDANTNPNPAGQGDTGKIAEDDSVYADPEKAKALAKSLRDEAAKSRKKAKDLESRLSLMEATQKKLKSALGGEDDEEADPEKLVGSLKSQNELLQVENGIAQLAIEHGITKANLDYFRFLLSQRFNSLEEGSECTDEDVLEIVQKVGAVSGKKSGGSTGLNADKRPDSGGGSAMTVEQFADMSLSEKSQLYVRDRAQYDKLFGDAVKNRLLK